MRLFLLIAGVLLVVIASGEGQTNNCSIDPDLISFEDKDLEAVMKSLYSSGNCSAVVWKKEVVNVLKKHKKEILDMSTRDKSMLRYLISFVVKPEAERPPPDYFLYLGTLSESELMNPLDFGPSSDSPPEPEEDFISPIFWKFGSDRETNSSTSATRRKRQLTRSPDVFRPSRTWSLQGQQPGMFSSYGESDRPPRFIGIMPGRYDEDERSKYRPPGSRDVFEFGNEMQQSRRDQFSYERPENIFSPNRPSNQKWNNDFIRPSTQQKPGPKNSSKNFQRNPVEYRPNRPQPKGRPGGSFSRPPVEASSTSFTPDSQRRPPFNVDGFYRPQRPQLENTDFIVPDDQSPKTNSQRNPTELSPNRPLPQGRPDGGFSRPPVEASSNSFTPDNQRRPPFNVDGFYRPLRPPLEDTDIIMPDDQSPKTNSQRNPAEFSSNRPQPQGRPDGGFSRPSVEASGNSFTPENQKRPLFNADGFFIPQRPPLVNTDIITNQVTTERPPRTTTEPGPEPWATPPSLCVRNCPNTPEFNPVCGSDRVTYSNPGRLRCEQQCGKANVDINYYGTCVTTTTPAISSRRIRSTNI